jgi:hypothetical protein
LLALATYQKLLDRRRAHSTNGEHAGPEMRQFKR